MAVEISDFDMQTLEVCSYRDGEGWMRITIEVGIHEIGDLAWIIHENIYRNGLAADGGFRRPQSPLGVPKSVLEPIQRTKMMNMQLNVAELIRQKCS